MMNRIRTYGLAVTEAIGSPHDDAQGIDEERIRAVVREFYRRARLDAQIGPTFETHVHNWDEHLSHMDDFWSAALLRTGRFSGNPIQKHQAIAGLSRSDFDRWIALFEATVRDLCPRRQAEAFLVRALRMREAMTKALRCDDRADTTNKVLPMNANPKRVIVTASCCNACEVHTIQVHHQYFPELRLEGMSAEQAAEFLSNRLTTSLDNVSSRSHTEAVRSAVEDIRAFLDRKEPAHPGRELTATGIR